MIPVPNNILVIQTAFIGDVILTLPMVQKLKEAFPSARIDVVVVPRAADLLKNHPSISQTLIYDKRKQDSGIRGFFRLSSQLLRTGYDLAVIPHRSLRSLLLARLARIPNRIGFNTSAAPFLLTERAVYVAADHEIERNLALLTPLGIDHSERILPSLYPGTVERVEVDKLLSEARISPSDRIVGIAPGTIWNTKRWPAERFTETAIQLLDLGFKVVLIGGADDADLGREIERNVARAGMLNTCGSLGLLASAELIRRCRVLLSNDSAPMHLAVAMRTPVAAIFGATVPAFGFAPYGSNDIVIETSGLECRPCGIHGGKTCPIGTFDCMMNIAPEAVVDRLQQFVL